MELTSASLLVGQFIGEEGLWLKALWGLDAADAKVIPQRFQQAINYGMFSTSPLDIFFPGCKADNLAAFWLDPLDSN